MDERRAFEHLYDLTTAFITVTAVNVCDKLRGTGILYRDSRGETNDLRMRLTAVLSPRNGNVHRWPSLKNI